MERLGGIFKSVSIIHLNIPFCSDMLLSLNHGHCGTIKYMKSLEYLS